MPNIAINEPVPFQMHSPRNVDAAMQLAADHWDDFAYLGGGCDLIDMMKRQWLTPGHVINLKNIDALDGIKRESDRIMIGAMTRLAELERGDLGDGLRALTAGAARIATPQIRNMGTAGGNLLQHSRCPYFRGPFFCYRHGGIVCDAHHGINREHALFGGNRCFTVTPSDLAPVVVALEGVIHVRSAERENTMPAANLFVLPAENITTLHRLIDGRILTAIEIPLRKHRRSAFVKQAIRNAWDFADASAAVAADIASGKVRNMRIVLGGVAATPWRARSAERVVEGGLLNKGAIDKAAEAATDGAAPLKYNGYKVGLTRKVVRDALTQLAA